MVTRQTLEQARDAVLKCLELVEEVAPKIHAVGGDLLDVEFSSQWLETCAPLSEKLHPAIVQAKGLLSAEAESLLVAGRSLPAHESLPFGLGDTDGTVMGRGHFSTYHAVGIGIGWLAHYALDSIIRLCQSKEPAYQIAEGADPGTVNYGDLYDDFANRTGPPLSPQANTVMDQIEFFHSGTNYRGDSYVRLLRPEIVSEAGGAMRLTEATSNEGITADQEESTVDGVDTVVPSGRFKKELSPSRLKAKAVYEWAWNEITGAKDMTIAELYDAAKCRLEALTVQNTGPEAEKLADLCDSLPPNSEAFGKYLRDAGIKRYDGSGKRTPGRSVRRSNQV